MVFSFKLMFMTIHKLKYILFLITYCISCFAYSQEINSQYNFVPVDEDLTPRPITAIVKDNENYMWIGTYRGGLFRCA